MPLYRGAKRGPFTLKEARTFSAIGPHLARFVGLAEKFAAFGVASELAALDQVRCAALVIDAVGIARHVNSAAECLLGEDFYLVRGRPVASDCASNRRLQRLISSTHRTERGAAPSNVPVVIDREEAPWLLVEAMPVTAFGSDVFSAGRTVLLLTDLTSAPRPDASLLSIAFGLTAAEAKLAARLSSGHGLDGAAASLGVSHETARSQLKAVFAKTRTSRQAELAALVTRLRPPVDS
jgi:DNA-binding CsgD family transcriptional regulator